MVRRARVRAVGRYLGVPWRFNGNQGHSYMGGSYHTSSYRRMGVHRYRRPASATAVIWQASRRAAGWEHQPGQGMMGVSGTSSATA
jgi:hypothetical protein